MVVGMVTGLAMTAGADVPPYVEVSCDDDSAATAAGENKKNITVPMGTSVTYTAFRNGAVSPCTRTGSLRHPQWNTINKK